MRVSPSRQPDLFDRRSNDADAARLRMQDSDAEAEAEFIERIRGELHSTLALLRSAETWPWKDSVEVILTQKRFNSLADRLPAREADALRASFDLEFRRVWANSYAQSGATDEE